MARDWVLRESVMKFLTYPGQATSAIVAYVHDAGGVHGYSDIASKEDAEKLLPQLEKLQADLRDIIDGKTGA